MKRLFALLLPLLAAVAWASPPACPDGSRGLQRPLAEEARELEKHAARCADDPGYLAWRGAVLLELGEPRQAADLLERALLLAPDHQGARLDYARALAALGEHAAAQALFTELAARDDLPPAVRDLLAAPPAPPIAAGWQGSGSVAFRVGYDSNLNRASHSSQLTLTAPGGDLVLPLDPRTRAQAGNFQEIEARLLAARTGPFSPPVEIQARLLARAASGRADLDQEQLEIVGLWRPNPDPKALHFLAGVSELRWQGALLQRAMRGGVYRAGDANLWPSCRPWFGLDLEERRHPAEALLDHQLVQAQASLVCDGRQPWVVQLAVGRELADRRPGGDAWRLAARALGQLPLKGGSRLEAEARLMLRREDEGYSPLLEHGARLAAASGLLRLAWRHPLTAELEVIVSGELERQAANLPLFTLSRHAVSIGIARRW